jgi:hypothetical protein
MLNEGLADLTKQPWLGIVVGAGDAWASKTLDELNERSVSDLEAAIVECEDEESPSPTSEESATSPVDVSPVPPASATDHALGTRITGTITWKLAGDPTSETGTNQSSSGSVQLILVSTNDFDFQVQPGSTYAYDHERFGCGIASKSGTLEQNFAGGGNELREGQFMMTGGPGRDLTMSLIFSDEYTCNDGVSAAHPVGFPGCPARFKVDAVYQGGSSDTYVFDCTVSGEFGYTGTVQGTLNASQ